MANDSVNQIGTQYSLKVNNQNSLMQNFVLFQKMVVTAKASFDPITLAWMVGSAAAGKASNPSVSLFTWSVDYSVNVGYMRQEGTPSNPRKFQTSIQKPVGLKDNNELAVSYDGNFPNGAPYFSGSPSNTTTGIIVANADGMVPSYAAASSAEMDLVLGVAMNKKPVVSVPLLPSIDYTFTPHPEYYIMSSKYTEGEVIDVEETSHVYQVEFDGVTDLALNYTEENQFQPA